MDILSSLDINTYTT